MVAAVTEQWMAAEAAAARLGVKPQTLYAYVSRGLVHSEPVPGTRRSRFLRADVERLAARQRRGGRARGLEVIVETELTLLDPTGRLAYRGWDVVEAVRSGAVLRGGGVVALDRRAGGRAVRGVGGRRSTRRPGRSTPSPGPR